MQPDKNKNKVLIAFIVTIFFLAAGLIIIWNKTVAGSVWPYLLIFCSIAALSYMFNIARQLTNSENIDTYIKTKVEEERVKIFKELEQQETENAETNQESVDIHKKVEQLSIKGNFKNIESLSSKVLKNLADELNLVQGILFIKQKNAFEFVNGFALPSDVSPPPFKVGENFGGEVAKTGDAMYITDIPEEYFKVESGLGNAYPKYLYIVPIKTKEKVIAIVELASFTEISELNKQIINNVLENISEKLEKTIKPE